MANTYDSASAVLGIACEACHGAGATHVRRQDSWTRLLLGQAIVDPAELSRSRKVEACGLCHGGTGRSTPEPFTYVPGDPLGDHIEVAPTTGDEAVDVHGNQVALLMASPCFRSSDMTCSTCHDVHRRQRDATAFSDRCLECHDVEHAGLPPGAVGNCVDCHMPRLPSNTILSTFEGDTLRPRVRTHLIRVYPDDGAP